MPLFRNRSGRLVPLKEKRIDLEKDIQALTERSLDHVFGYQMVTSEFQLKGLRIDTLAFDRELKSFVIIEYKRDRSFSVVDQGFAYLSLMLNNKADFILKHNETQKDTLASNRVDWTQAKVLFLAASFTSYQLNAVNFRDLPIELWQVQAYEDLVYFNRIKASEGSESIKTVSSSKAVQSVSSQVKTFREEDHFKRGGEKGRALYEELRDRIQALDPNIEIKPTKYYIGFRLGGYNVLAIHIRKNYIWLDLPRHRPQDLRDPDDRVFYNKTSLKNLNMHLSYFRINEPADVDYAMSLARQVYEHFTK